MVLIKDNFRLTGGLRAYGVVAGILALCLLVGIANFALADAAVQPGSGIVDLLALLAMVLGAVGLAFLGAYSLYLLAKYKSSPSHICFSQNGIELDGETLRFDEVKRIKMTDPSLSGMRVLPQERFMWMRLQDGSRKLADRLGVCHDARRIPRCIPVRERPMRTLFDNVRRSGQALAHGPMRTRRRRGVAGAAACIWYYGPNAKESP